MKKLLLMLNGCSCILQETSNGVFEVYSVDVENLDGIENPVDFLKMSRVHTVNVPLTKFDASQIIRDY